MYKKKECVAMLLAGGQGSRLYALTTKIAKPAVTFGGKYRIIDFPLSNCVNSGIDTVGVLTQYQPLVLNEYIGNGQPWDLDRSFGGVHILSPYQAKNRSDWYKGTANAIYQNLYFIKTYQPKYVLILSGDHIYKMDYSKMLEFHKENEADCTIAAIKVPMEEASRFGIVNTDESGRINEFEEKPKKPKSNLASMGIYIFTAEKLYEYLEEDDKTKGSANDFGKNVLPAMLKAGEKMFAYTFEGYWKDVGTINSLFEANMDLLGDKPTLDLSDVNWRIHSRNPIAPPHYAGKDAVILNSIVSLGCDIEGVVENSILSSSVIVEKGAVVKDSILMSGAVIKSGAAVKHSIIDENAVVGENASVGGDVSDSSEIAVIGREYKVADGASVAAGEILDANEQ
ncbi:MAG: glucose-1-phosphate adenylyltransferase [Christensenellaceae bacterium]|nr:glucose-1-phosphate adenylyltransferase [Christensenellaceae bacterium]MDY2851263.1 glucose-1-phosphate adenylyltransferase [Christensenellaceae bacterium]